MKKLLLTAALLIPTASHAQSVVFKPYAGIDVQRTSYSYNDNYGIGGGAFLDGDTILEDNLYGVNIHVGNRFHENFGVELGYFRHKEESKDIAAGTMVGPGTVALADFSTDVKTHGFTLDALGYLPVHENVDLIGTAGVTWTDAEIKLSVAGVGSDNADEDEFGYRAGGGVQYNFTDSISARTLVRYQYADFDNIADDAWTASLGVNFSF